MDAMEIFRRYFESQFEAIEESPAPPITKSPEIIDDGDREDGFDGFSSGSDISADEEEEEEEEQAVEIVHHDSTKKAPRPLMSKQEVRAFMSSKPPPSGEPTPSATKNSKSRSKDADSGDEKDEDEALNLKNDLALQRLLRESHLLGAGSSTLEATGAARLKALNLRIEALGGKREVEKQNTPMHIRKGIEEKKSMREKKRRREAKEAGIVLEKEVKERKIRKRVKGMGVVGEPGVGRWKNGGLVLSKRDVASITGGGEKRSGGGKGRKGGKRR
ncbi:hypothetical protein FN846DRAFT_775219 [Sphaerosporella brunnea]|uniref:Uncharacterized protein n=1 Tax=Sphaerosporella brunnea TaxID=1250544 RepID=A0A5J5F2Z0_9PEZI|nr:hypothetical protein FN846DRAFT_775219 [Sphaerosporella brunnea]